MRLAFVFSGQGSQYLNMAIDLLDAYPSIEQEANLLLGYDVRHLLSHESLLHQTEYTQPLIFLHQALVLEHLKTLNLLPEAVLGFSLGEYTAYYSAGVLSFSSAIKLIQKRAMAMQQCSMAHPGKMAAVIGGSVDLIEEVIRSIKTEKILRIANYNSPNQHVISGDEKSFYEAIKQLKEHGIKRIIELQVSGAFHTELMEEAGRKIESYAQTLAPKTPQVPIWLNATARPWNHQDFPNIIKTQTVSPVLFEPSIRAMISEGFTHFLEIGPKKVLSGLIQKIDETALVCNMDTLKDIDQVKGWLNTYVNQR